jgi:hypothetical protein
MKLASFRDEVNFANRILFNIELYISFIKLILRSSIHSPNDREYYCPVHGFMLFRDHWYSLERFGADSVKEGIPKMQQTITQDSQEKQREAPLKQT